MQLELKEWNILLNSLGLHSKDIGVAPQKTFGDWAFGKPYGLWNVKYNSVRKNIEINVN